MNSDFEISSVDCLLHCPRLAVVLSISDRFVASLSKQNEFCRSILISKSSNCYSDTCLCS